MKITLPEVRLSFPNLHKPRAVNEGDDPRYSASFLMRVKEDAKTIVDLRNAIKHVAGEQWGAKLPKGIKFCVHKGDEKPETPGYGKEVVYITTSNENRVPVVDRNKTPLVAGDPRPYAGCYVNAVIRLWAQDNKWGKRVNAQLLGVQFVRDGEAFGEKPFDAEEEFTDLSEGDGQDRAGDKKPEKSKGKPPQADLNDGNDGPDEDEIPI